MGAQELLALVRQYNNIAAAPLYQWDTDPEGAALFGQIKGEVERLHARVAALEAEIAERDKDYAWEEVGGFGGSAAPEA